MPDMQSVFVIFIAVACGITFIGFGGFFIIFMWKNYKRLSNMNCLYWKHASNTEKGNDNLELIHVKTFEEVKREYFKSKRLNPNPLYYQRKNRHDLTMDTYNDIADMALAEYNKQNIIPDGAATYKYKEAWWQFWDVRVKWVYEHIDSEKKEMTIKEFKPDDWIDYSITTTELANNLDWPEGIFQNAVSFFQKVAYAAPVLLGLASIGCIFMLSVYLVGGE